LLDSYGCLGIVFGATGRLSFGSGIVVMGVLVEYDAEGRVISARGSKRTSMRRPIMTAAVIIVAVVVFD
jgi:hypothetical protein